MQYYNNILCVEGGWLYNEAEVMSHQNYKLLCFRGHLQVLRRGCRNTPALVAYDSIPERFRLQIEEKYGNPYKKVSHYQFSDELQPDPEAATYYSQYRLPDGRNLPKEKQRQYCTNAEILNAIHKLHNNAVARRRAMGGRRANLWSKLSNLVNSLDTDRYKHTLPANDRRLKSKYREYIKGGYMTLIHKGYGHDNSRKVTAKIERLLLSLYTLPNKPYATTVSELYLQFLGGGIQVADMKTGEIFNREDFKDSNGVEITISEATVWNYLNDPKNRVLLDKYRSGALEFSSTHRPHHHRHGPQFSLSKISMDDRDPQRKMHNGKTIKAYYAYDVTSGCVIGAAYSKSKDKELFINCLRDMFRFINNHGLGMPMEVEVEHHLVKHYKDDLMKAGTIFPFVRWANPGNAQEKHAETFNRIRKYQYEKRHQPDIGRWYAKLEANRTRHEKIFDSENDNYKEKKYDFEELVADDMMINQMINNDLHPNQKKYKGMTRLEVLMYCLNPNLAKYDPALLARYIGERTPTSVRRSQYVTVQYAKYQLPSPELLSRLQPNNYEVDAFWIPGEKGLIDRVYLYQNDTFICACDKITTYNTATAEQTQADRDIYQRQASYVSSFDSMVKKDEKVSGVVILKPEVETPDPEIVQTIEEPVHDAYDDFEDAIAAYSGEYWKEKARADI